MSMKDGVAKIGHKRASESPGEMRKISFRVDDETFEALQQLTEDVESQIVHGRQSVAFRRAIMDAYRRRK